MAIRADLHMHSAHSLDGDLNVDQILKLCNESGIETVSVTDHNITGATGEAIECGKHYGMKVIPGIEIDCNFDSTDLHLLGYQINWQGNDFAELEKDIAGKILASFSAMVENLGKLNIHVDASEILAKAKGRLPSGELIAEVLLTNPKYDGIKALDPYRPGGRRSDMPYLNFYIDFFAQGKPAYVKIDFMDYNDAVSLITRNGGIPVVAHPGLNFRGHEEVVTELLKLGAMGLEVFNNYHNEKQINFFADIVIKQKALMTCGSDFHGKTKPLIYPGNFMSVDRYEGYVRESVEELLC